MKERSSRNCTQEKETAFKDWVETWFFRKKDDCEESTLLSYRGILDNHLIPHFNDIPLSEIKRRDMKDFIHKKIGNKAWKKESLQNHPLFYTAIFTGTRRGELLGLRWGEIDWVNSKIHLERSVYKGRFKEPKTENSTRDIDMGPNLKEVLKWHKSKQNEARLKVGGVWADNDLIFCNSTGSVLDGDNLLKRDFARISKRSGLRHFRIHDFRHTFASILISAGHSLKYVQHQLGHGLIQVTFDVYAELMEEAHQGVAKKTEDWIFDKMNEKKEPASEAVL